MYCVSVCLGSLRRFHDLLPGQSGGGGGGGGLGEQQLAAFYLTQDMMAHAALLGLAAQSLSLVDRCLSRPHPRPIGAG